MIPRILTLLFLLPLQSAAAEPALTVGFAEVDVTPKLGDKPVFMAGFGHDRVAKKIHDPIVARAIVLSDGKKKIALVCVDVVGLFLPTVESIRKELTGFDYVMVSSTHNHEGPDTLGLWGSNPFKSGVDAEYMKLVVAGVVKAAKDADKAQLPATAHIGTAAGPELLNDNRKPEVKHDTLVAIRFDPIGKKDKKPLGVLVQWNVHPELLGSKNTEISADHVGYTVKHVSEKHGCPVAYFTGTVGGLMTSLDVPLADKDGKLLADDTFEKTAAYGLAVGKLTDTALGKTVPLSLTPFDLRIQPVLLPVDNNLYKLAWTAGVLKRNMYLWEKNATPKEFREATDVTKPVAVKTEVGYLKLGELEVAAIPGEIYPELVLGKVQDPVDPGADFPDAPIEPAIYTSLGKHRMIVGLANDEIGYIIPKRQWDEKPPYCYGLKKSQYGEINSCGPDVAPILCTTFRDLVKKK